MLKEEHYKTQPAPLPNMDFSQSNILLCLFFFPPPPPPPHAWGLPHLIPRNVCVPVSFVKALSLLEPRDPSLPGIPLIAAAAVVSPIDLLEAFKAFPRHPLSAPRAPFSPFPAVPALLPALGLPLLLLLPLPLLQSALLAPGPAYPAMGHPRARPWPRARFPLTSCGVRRRSAPRLPTETQRSFWATWTSCWQQSPRRQRRKKQRPPPLALNQPRMTQRGPSRAAA